MSSLAKNPADFDSLYEIWRTRDCRYDGKVFIGVHTTGIYCRPICPAKTPLKKNVSFYVTSTAAEAAGFRPCLRCRPESSPGTPAWSGTSSTVARALRLIAEGWADESGLPALSERLGIGERQLRRLFVEHLGAAPLAIIQTRKLDLARKLLDETRLPIAEIAFASGFESIRRFNDAFKTRFSSSPSEIRARPSKTLPAGSESLKLSLPYRLPLDWDSLLVFLRNRAIPGVEHCSEDSYSRTFELNQKPGWLKVTCTKQSIELHVPGGSAQDLIEIIRRTKMVLDLNADPHAISERLLKSRDLRQIVTRSPGLRLPGAWDGFEIAVRAVLGQQISVTGARTLAARIVQTYGKSFAGPAPLTHLFPTPAVLAKADLTALGVIGARADAIQALAQKVLNGKLVLSPSADTEPTVQELRSIRGIGEWTAQYIRMRALGDPDVLLKTDLIIRRELGELIDEEQAWAPWGSYATLYLWKKNSARRVRK